jgi:hypothetical protein
LSSLIIKYEMKGIEDKLDRRIREQEMVCLINGWLLEHYEEQKVEQLKQDKDRGRGTDQSFAPSTLPTLGVK